MIRDREIEIAATIDFGLHCFVEESRLRGASDVEICESLLKLEVQLIDAMDTFSGTVS